MFPSWFFEKYEPSFDESMLVLRARRRIWPKDKCRTVPFCVFQCPRKCNTKLLQRPRKLALNTARADHSVIAYYAKAKEEWDDSERIKK